MKGAVHEVLLAAILRLMCDTNNQQGGKAQYPEQDFQIRL